MEMAAILDFVCTSWEHDIFVVIAPNAVKIGMQLAESIPWGGKAILPIFLNWFYKNIYISCSEKVCDCIHSYAII